MATQLETAVSALKASYQAYPMPMAPLVALSAMTVGMITIVAMLYFNNKTTVITTHRTITFVCALAAALAVLALGNSSIKASDLASIAVRAQVAGECRMVHTAAVTAPDQKLTPADTQFVIGACGPTALQTMNTKTPVAGTGIGMPKL